jgi:cytochrome P450
MCIGQPFALFYMKLALATMVSQFEVDLEPSQKYRQSFFFGVMMPKRLQARFRRRPV